MGALPRIRSIMSSLRGENTITTPPSHLNMLCSVCHFSQTLSCLTLGETKEPQERERGQQAENEGRDSTGRLI